MNEPGAGLPLTYDECRARFARAAARSGRPLRSDAIDALGPEGQRLTVDSVRVGPERPERALIVLGGVHGVEGFIASTVQCDLLGRLAARGLPDGLGVLVIHAVNPWGMAWWRRQNESNVDLNRNWRRDEVDPPPNAAYDELHPLACPDVEELPSTDDLLASAMEIVATRGMDWVRDGITSGQYAHPDGLHYGGSRTERSNHVVRSLVEDLIGVRRGLVVDLHTGHGPSAELTLLSDQPPDSRQHHFFSSRLGSFRTEATIGNADATTGPKVGQIANGIRDLLGPDGWYSTSAEFGTADDVEQLAATYQESWVWRTGRHADPGFRDVVWRYRCCFTPDDAAWVIRCRELGARLLDDAIDAI